MTATVAAPTNAPVAPPSLAGKYLTFNLGRECYGFPVLKVREIIRYVTPTQVPQLPAHVKGVINLRGKVIPVVDLRLKFGFPADQMGERVCIVVVQIQASAGGKTVMGMVVDGVEEVVQIASQEIEAAPDFGAGMNTDYILGMAKIKGTVKTLLDIDKVLTAEAIAAISSKSNSQPA